jgi:hypothetical protein
LFLTDMISPGQSRDAPRAAITTCASPPRPVATPWHRPGSRQRCAARVH